MLTPSAAATVLLVGLASGAIALAIARGKPFAAMHERLWPRRDAGAPQPPGLRGWAAYLLSCFWCLGAWLCAGMWAWQGLPEGVAWPVAWGASWAVSTLLAAAVDRLAGE